MACLIMLVCHKDLPRTKREAQIFQRTGIIPTHVIQLIVSDDIGKIIRKNRIMNILYS